jgi:hypothetical protein
VLESLGEAGGSCSAAVLITCLARTREQG